MANQIWEYKVWAPVTRGTSAMATEIGAVGPVRVPIELEKIGRDGWELVSVIPAGDGDHVFYFKRQASMPMQLFDSKTPEQVAAGMAATSGPIAGATAPSGPIQG